MKAIFTNDPVIDSGELWLERVLTQRTTLHVVTTPPQRSLAPPVPERIKLSHRELQIVRLVTLGLRNSEIAETLGLAEQTVKNHLHNVVQKTGTRDRLELALYAVYHRLYLG